MEIAPITEGEGEDEAIRVLLGRVIFEIDPWLYVHVRRPLRRPKDHLKNRDGLVRAIESVSRQLSGVGAVFVLIDADKDCPATLGPELLRWAQAARSDIPISVVVAKVEYEAWFLAAAESLRGHRGLPPDLEPPPEPEAISGAKEWLSLHMPRSEPYGPTSHRASFSTAMDLEAARQRAASFDKLCRDVRRLVEAMRPPAS